MSNKAMLLSLKVNLAKAVLKATKIDSGFAKIT